MLKPRASIAGLPPFSPLITGRTGLSLDLNENLAGCSPRVLARLRTLSTEDIARYPQREVGERLVADFLGVASEQVLLTNGADEALWLLFSTYLGEGSELLITDPTFVMYPMLGHGVGAELVRVPAGENFGFPAAEIVSHITPRTRLIAVANPNNPTGTVAAASDLLRVVTAAPGAAVLIDEAYFDLHGETLLGELPHHPNLFVARTFSKVYGLAGLRLGVLIGPAEQIEYIRRFCSPFNVNAVALACLEEAIADQDFVRDCVAQVKQGREQIAQLCRELGLQHWPSSANFVLVRVGKDAAPFVEAMLRRGVMIRDISASPGCNGCVRVTVPAKRDLDKVLESMRQAFTETERRAFPR